jgi:hypothetical protein
MLKLRFRRGVRNMRTSFFILAHVFLFVVETPRAVAINAVTSGKIEKARELVLKGDRTAAIKFLKDASRETPTVMSKSKSKHVESSQELTQAWLEIAEIFLTDKGQNQFSLAESIWLTKPKDALDVLTPLLKVEDGNLQVSRLGARSALRINDCVRADAFVQQAEIVFPLGPEVKLLRQQAQDCLNGTNAALPSLKISAESEATEVEGAFRLLAVKDALRRKDLKQARIAISAWETSKSASVADNPQFWYWKWRVSIFQSNGETAPATGRDASRDRAAARKYLRLCSEMTPRRRKNFAIYPELCLATETVESDLKSSDKAGT